ncbi:hypothetical protein ALC56_13690 [Trachymyrmex septentrionalis]|uniref:RIIa domain-containing protein n=1 Tax=Trachymyrmex septentrionalis TaxID=34720 RepID=A0A195EVK8_9HYME|nr:PREDICTED: uncharacterized protein LOC108754892 [Trachymyrmex septentrionalis]KYN31937.1 hypothetical protein ALC56_13690 [Trachymyrmex septentrionalis]
MNVLLQKHGAKHICKVPEGLRELSTDIAREVLRSQPRNIYCFVADYVETLLITRENAKVAVKVVDNILLGSQAIVDILRRSGLSFKQIARAAPRIQTAFRAYLDAADMRATQVYDDTTCDERSKVSLQSILQETGLTLELAEKHATIIQVAFREHYKRMLLNESRGMIQWQRAATRTLEILRKAGASQAEASKAAILIQATYRGYYTRKNLKMKMQAMQPQGEEKRGEIAGWDMCEELGLTPMRANEAASTIQKAYRRYRERKSKPKSSVESPRSREAIMKNLHQKVFDEVMIRAGIPAEFGNREDLTEAAEELQRALKDRLARLAQNNDEEEFAYEEEPDESFEEVVDSISVPEDWQEDREIKIESVRDEGTNANV